MDIQSLERKCLEVLLKRTHKINPPEEIKKCVLSALRDLRKNIKFPEWHSKSFFVVNYNDFGNKPISIQYISTSPEISLPPLDEFVNLNTNPRPSLGWGVLDTAFETLRTLSCSQIIVSENGFWHSYGSGMFSLMKGEEFYDIYSSFDFVKWVISHSKNDFSNKYFSRIYHPIFEEINLNRVLDVGEYDFAKQILCLFETIDIIHANSDTQHLKEETYKVIFYRTLFPQRTVTYRTDSTYPQPQPVL